jgi:hypothetical protein
MIKRSRLGVVPRGPECDASETVCYSSCYYYLGISLEVKDDAYLLRDMQ